MIQMGLSLLIVALESGVDSVASYTSLLYYVKDDLCKHLFNVRNVFCFVLIKF
jgi:hypothetical protein